MNISYNFNHLANRKHDKSKKWDKEFITSRYGQVPDDYISMWIADLDFELAPPIQRQFQEILDNKSFGYTYDYKEFYGAIKNYLKHKTDREIVDEEIILDYSIVSSLYHMAQTFADDSSKVLINSPVYNPFREASVRNKMAIIENELYIGNDARYHIDFEKLEEQMKMEKPDVYILCSPHNPGGKVWTKDELEKIASLCLENDVVLVVDEAHSDHVNGVTFTSILTLDEKYLQNVVYLNSPNKAFNIAGLKTSFVVIPNQHLRAAYKQTMLENHIDEPNIFGIAGLVSAYTPEGLEWNKQSYDYMLTNYEWIKNYIATNMPQLDLMPLDATYVIWLNVSKTGMSGDQFTKELAQSTGVLVQEGSSFGKAGEKFVRINLGTSLENVKEAFSRIHHWINNEG